MSTSQPVQHTEPTLPLAEALVNRFYLFDLRAQLLPHPVRLA